MINQQDLVPHIEPPTQIQRLVVTLPSSFYYTLINNNRDLLQTGPLDVLIIKECDCQKVMLQVGHFVLMLDEDWKVVKCEYQDTVGYYLIDPLDNLTVLVLQRYNPDLINFEGYLKGFVCVLEMEEVEKNDRIRSILQTHWSLYAQKAPVNADGFQKFISSAGHAVGKGIVSVGSKLSNYWNKNKTQTETAEVQPLVEHKSSWFSRLKEKTGRLFGRTSKVIKPVVDPIVRKGKEMNEKLGDKIDQGDSQVMKYIKDVASISSEAFKNIYLGAKAAAKGKDKFYSESNAPTGYRQSSPHKVRSPKQSEEFEQNSGLNLLQNESIKDQLLDK